jgi:hypothetical protein
MTPATVPATSEMPASRWALLTLALIALTIGLHILIAYHMDVFGIFRDTRGRALITSEHERKAKYLLSQHYVPENFDALIVGASASVNWNPGDLTGYRFYNESLEGGDASEQRRIVEQALPTGHFKVALVGLYPRITALHVLQDGFDQVKASEALGSIGTLGVEYDVLHDRIAHTPSIFFPNGSHLLPVVPSPRHGQLFPPLDASQDPEAVADYRALVEELMAHGVRVIYVASPLLGSSYEPNKQTMQDYMASVARTMPPAPLIDFNGPEYAAFRDDNTNFIDNVHLSPKGAETLSQLLNIRMHQILGD